MVVQGVASVVLAWLGEACPLKWLTDSLVAISGDEARDAPVVSYSGARGHKLFEVDFS